MNELLASMDFLGQRLMSMKPGLLFASMLLLASLIVLEKIINSLNSRRGESGLNRRSTLVSVDGTQALPVRDYVSEMQGIAGRPDAVISENGFLIPVERKPLARKLRDRYVAQLLVYMRLIEEFEGKRPPYGYLILGPNCRQIKIENTPARQAWLQTILDEMRGILAGGPAKPAPHPKKCRQCDVRAHCAARADLEQPRAANSAHSVLIKLPKRGTPIQ